MNFNDFKHGKTNVNGIQNHYRIGGTGEPLFLIHGWPQQSLMWHTIAPILAEQFTVITPDLRGAGGSSIPTSGYDKKTMATDIYELVKHLGFETVNLAGYDLGSGVAYSLAAQHPDMVEKLAVMELACPALVTKPSWRLHRNGMQEATGTSVFLPFRKLRSLHLRVRKESCSPGSSGTLATTKAPLVPNILKSMLNR
jgi:pimeloyl-ACP methyl ester carboxylesterase